MQTPLQITFRNIDASPDVEAKVRERVMELEQFSSRRAIETTISSRCHRSCGSGRPRLRFRATIGPNFSTHRRTVSLLISNPRSANRIFDVAVTQGETQIEPNRLPDHIWWEAMAGLGDYLHLTK